MKYCLAVYHQACRRWSAGSTSNLNLGKIRCKCCNRMILLRHTKTIGLNVPHHFCKSMWEAQKVVAELNKNGQDRDEEGTFRSAQSL